MIERIITHPEVSAAIALTVAAFFLAIAQIIRSIPAWITARLELRKAQATQEAMLDRVQSDAISMAAATIAQLVNIISMLVINSDFDKEAMDTSQKIMTRLDAIVTSMEQLVYIYDPDKSNPKRFTQEKESINGTD